MKKLLTLGLILLCLPYSLQARVDPRDGEEAITAEPQVTIVNDDDKMLQIHQVNGQIYGIHVVPKNGVPYNLVDPDGEGNFIRKPGDSRILVPEWVLISW